jgi:hypothetical protein
MDIRGERGGVMTGGKAPAKLQDLRVKLFTDSADKAQIVVMAQLPWIGGFTTNPS